MPKREAEFLQRLRTAFAAEARDHLQVIEAGLLALEQATSGGEREGQVEAVFRHTHSLKGAARAASYPRIESICQSLEEIFAQCKRGERVLVAEEFDILHAASDLVAAHVQAEGGALSGEAAEIEADVLSRLQGMTRGGRAPAPAPSAGEAGTPDLASRPPGIGPALADSGVDGSVRVETARLDRVLLAAEELLLVKQAVADRAEALQRLEARFGEWSKQWSAAQPALRRLRAHGGARDGAGGDDAAVGRVLEFLDWSFGYVRSVEGAVRAIGRSAIRDERLAGKQVDELLEDSKALLMLPFAVLAEALPRLVRDLGRDQGKEIDLELQGEDVRLDKRMIELLRGPLVHLVRNAVDHGIETPAQRERTGKRPRGKLRIGARPLQGNRVEIVVEDDGQGLDPQRLRSAAVRSGILVEAIAGQLDDRDALELAFRSDVSTSPIITEISGRGLGLAIVREQVEHLGGRTDLVSRPGEGACFRMVLPQSMATVRGLFVESGGQSYVLPAASVERVVHVPRAELKTVSGRQTVQFQDQALPVARLQRLLELPDTTAPAAGMLTLVVVGVGPERLALVVDDVMHDEEVLVKRLQYPLVRVRNVAGATVGPGGKPLPILNVTDLVKSARRLSGEAAGQAPIATQGPRLAQRVLLAEDSITSRLLLKGILEAAGCEVKAVSDGVEAFTALRSEPFDLLVSDIEMPRMNGFDLTARVRADRTLSDLPVVLVTALARREDRERGIDVGANAYITKGGFDQRELLAAVRRLAAPRERS